MSAPPPHPIDPIGWCAATALAFFGLCLVRLTIPSAPYFDEIHYLPAARALLELSGPLNREHPLLGKEIMTAGIALFGDGPLGWRIFSALAGTGALFAFMRALWFASLSRFAAISGGILLATAFPLFIHSRIAMLDIFMIAFVMLAFWQCIAALREAETARFRLAVAGVALGCAMGAKWNAAVLAIVPGLTFLIIRLKAAGAGFITATRARPIAGISLPETALWLGALPLVIYALTFAPAFFYANEALSLSGLIPFHVTMLELQASVVKPHPYQSQWYHWVGNWRAIWYFYEVSDGAQRGILLVGNPLTMLLGLPALLWCAFVGIFRKRWDALGAALLYGVAIGFWMAAAKPVQFYYHYLLPSCFLIAALALALDALWRANRPWLALAPIVGSAALFVYFWPILTAAPLDGPMAFTTYAWLDSWR